MKVIRKGLDNEIGQVMARINGKDKWQGQGKVKARIVRHT